MCVNPRNPTCRNPAPSHLIPDHQPRQSSRTWLRIPATLASTFFLGIFAMLSRALTRSSAPLPRRSLFQNGPRSVVRRRLPGLTFSPHNSQLRHASASRPFPKTKPRDAGPQSSKSDASRVRTPAEFLFDPKEWAEAFRFAVYFLAVITLAEYYFDTTIEELATDYLSRTNVKLSHVKFADEKTMKRVRWIL